MAAPFYNQGDQDIYASGNKFIPQEQYRLGPYTPPAIMGQNTNAGIVNTQAAGSYMGYPSYEAWLLAQGGGGDGGGQDEIEEDTFSMGMSPGALGGKLPGFGNWAKRTAGTLGHIYSQLPTPTNLLRKGVMKWRENRDIKRAEEAAASKAGKDAADAAAAGQGTNIGGGWTQTNTGGGGATFTGGGGQTHQGFSNTPAGFAAAAESEGTFAQGGRIGMAKGKIPRIPKPRAKTKMNWLDKLFAGIGGISTLVKHPNLYQSMSGATESGRAAQAARLAKYGKWGARGMGLLNPWTAVPFGLMGLAQYGVGKAFDPYRDETGKIGAEGHAQLASAARAREALMAERNAARQNQNAGGIARLL